MVRDRKAHPSSHWPWLLSAALATLGLPARADWLVTREGQVIETEGSWSVDGQVVKFKTLQGTLASIRTSEIDLEASAAETSRRAAPPPEPAPAPPPAPSKKAVLVLTDKDVRHVDPAKAVAERSPIILYMTSWCPYCRQAKELLTSLGEPFVEKDIESSQAIHEEYRVKGQGYKGIPMFDIDGRIVQGFRQGEVRRLVEARQAAARSSAQRPKPNPEAEP